MTRVDAGNTQWSQSPICVWKILKLIDLLKEKYLFVVKPKLRIIVIQLSTTIIHFCSMKQAGLYCIYTRTCSGQLYVTDKGVFKKLDILKLLVLWGWLLDTKYIIWRNFECTSYNLSLSIHICNCYHTYYLWLFLIW